MSTAERVYALATAHSASAKRWPQLAPMTWSELIDWLDLDKPADHKECGGYVMGTLRDERRSRRTVESRSVLALDLDQARPRFRLDAEVELSGTAALLHTTYSSNRAEPRWRVLVPLTRDVSPDEYEAIADAMMARLGDGFDSGSREPERLMYRPSAMHPESFECCQFVGDPLDPDAVLAEHQDRDVKPPHADSLDHGAVKYAELGSADQERAANAAQRTAERWRAQLDGIEAWPEGERDEKDRGWDALNRDAAWALARVAAAPWSPWSADIAYGVYLELVPEDVRQATGDKWDRAWVKACNEPNDPPPWIEPEFEVLPDLNTGEARASEGELHRSSLLGWCHPMDFGELFNPDRARREFVVDPMIAAGTSTALIAPAGHRKSLLLFRIALAVARGEPDFAGMNIPRRRRVLYVDMELTEDDVRERLESFGIDASTASSVSHLTYLHLPDLEPLDTAVGGRKLAEAVDFYGLQAGDVVMLDSYQRVTESGENDSDTTRGYYKHTGLLLKKRGLTVIRTDNTGKDASKGARGSSGKRDDVDVEYLLRSTGEYVEISTGKVRQRGVGELTLRVSVNADGVTEFRSGSSEERARVDECVELLEELQPSSQNAAEKLVEDRWPDTPRKVKRDAYKRWKQARRDFVDDATER